MKTPKGTELPLLSLKGKDYLQVAHRLVWFREERPSWAIETEFAVLSPEYSIAKATIKTDDGKIIATAHKREDAKHFPDFMEKSETGAIGRALALIGYGTQFAPELDEGDRIVDAPLTRVFPEQPTPMDGANWLVGAEAPMCCKKPMMISKFNKNELYCFSCKAKQARAYDDGR